MQHLSVLFPEEDPRDGSVGPTEPGPGVRDVVSAADPQPLTERTKERCLLPSSAAARPELLLHPSPARGFSPLIVRTVLLPHVRCERGTEVRAGAKPRPLPPSRFPTQNPCPHRTACPALDEA